MQVPYHTVCGQPMKVLYIRAYIKGNTRWIPRGYACACGKMLNRDSKSVIWGEDGQGRARSDLTGQYKMDMMDEQA